jgi:hypothetical protein
MDYLARSRTQRSNTGKTKPANGHDPESVFHFPYSQPTFLRSILILYSNFLPSLALEEVSMLKFRKLFLSLNHIRLYSMSVWGFEPRISAPWRILNTAGRHLVAGNSKLYRPDTHTEMMFSNNTLRRPIRRERYRSYTLRIQQCRSLPYALMRRVQKERCVEFYLNAFYTPPWDTTILLSLLASTQQHSTSAILFNPLDFIWILVTSTLHLFLNTLFFP